MWLPKKIKVGGHWVRVIFPHTFMEDTKLIGLCQLPQNRILVSGVDDAGTKLAESTCWVTFFHELIHRMDRVTGHKIFMGHDNEEGVVDGFAECFYQILRDSPQLRRAIFEMGGKKNVRKGMQERKS